MRLSGGDQILINLSFGIDLIAAVREFSLSDADFAATELAMELLYLAEANAAVTRELRGLNLRLEGARMAAEEEAMTDPLTGLRNRRAADLFLERLCNAGAPFGLLHLDLDYFKAVNDTLGHAAGDLVLETRRPHPARPDPGRGLRRPDRGGRIRGHRQRPDRSCRLLLAIADRIIARVSQPIEFRGARRAGFRPVSASFGPSTWPIPIPRSILAAADRALYAAKHAGRSRAVLLPVAAGLRPGQVRPSAPCFPSSGRTQSASGGRLDEDLGPG